MKASEFMTKNVITCNQNQTVEEAATIMAENGFSVIPVVNDAGELVGIITESDFVSKTKSVPHAMASLKVLFGKSYNSQDVEEIYKEAKSKKLSEVMTKNPKTVDSDETLDEVVSFMGEKDIKRVPVVDGGKVVGIITRKNLISAFTKVK
ncbi:MAG: CBS domain-containing protein [Halobacteriovoraceae bacterium]|nr:CBS domain-containing protein [Halobacteriovoraceae bacterium]